MPFGFIAGKAEARRKPSPGICESALRFWKIAAAAPRENAESGESISECSMNLHRQANDLLREKLILRFHLENPILHSVNLVNLVIP